MPKILNLSFWDLKSSLFIPLITSPPSLLPTYKLKSLGQEWLPYPSNQVWEWIDISYTTIPTQNTMFILCFKEPRLHGFLVSSREHWLMGLTLLENLIKSTGALPRKVPSPQNLVYNFRRLARLRFAHLSGQMTLYKMNKMECRGIVHCPIILDTIRFILFM